MKQLDTSLKTWAKVNRTKAILFLALGLFACKKETPQPTQTCNCDYVTYISWDFSDYQFVEWQREESNITDCWKNGEIVSEINEIQNGYPSIKRKVIECE
jgi:hypothetical protein